MRADQEFESNMNDLRNDPDHETWSAGLEGQADYDLALDLPQGIQKCIDRGVRPEVIEAYSLGWAHACIASLARNPVNPDEAHVVPCYHHGEPRPDGCHPINCIPCSDDVEGSPV